MKNKGKTFNNRKYKVKHGMSHTRIYKIWTGMKMRCLNKNNTNYHRYGGRGITVCKDWLKFENFYNDMKHGYSDKVELDRIDNTKGYSKENCRWASHFKNCNNRSTSKRIFKYKNKMYTIAELVKIGNFRPGTLQERIKNGWSIKKAMETPVKKYKFKKRSCNDLPN